MPTLPTKNLKKLKFDIGKARKLLDHPLVTGYGAPVGAVIIGLLLLLLVIYPSINSISTIRADRSILQESLSVLTEKVSKLEVFAGNTAALDSEYTSFNLAVPTESNIPTLLTQVQEICTISNVSITAMQFGGEAGSTSGQEPEAAVPATYSEVRLKLTVEGTYGQITSLLENLEVASRIIDVENINYSTTDSDQPDVLTAEFTLVSYYTPKPTISASTPVTFDFADQAYERNSQVLQKLTKYEPEITSEETGGEGGSESESSEEEAEAEEEYPSEL